MEGLVALAPAVQMGNTVLIQDVHPLVIVHSSVAICAVLWERSVVIISAFLVMKTRILSAVLSVAQKRKSVPITPVKIVVPAPEAPVIKVFAVNPMKLAAIQITTTPLSPSSCR